MIVSPIPKIPEARGYESSGRATLMPRYEDITQDGRVHLSSLMVGLTAVWRSLAHGERLTGMTRKGILPILNRILMHGEEGPFSVHTPIHVEGTWRLAKERGGERIFLDMWLEAYAPHAQTHGKQPDENVERALVGRLYAEHVITRPFATTPAERKVTRLEGLAGVPEIPEDEHPYEEAGALVASRALEPLREHRFGMVHTDPNQHVNSLVYPRLFEESVSARAIEQRLGQAPELMLAREIELRYRKPFFTGEQALIAAELRTSDKGIEAVGAFTGTDPARPSTAIAMVLR